MLILGQKSCILGPTSLKFHDRTDIIPHINECFSELDVKFMFGNELQDKDNNVMSCKQLKICF